MTKRHLFLAASVICDRKFCSVFAQFRFDTVIPSVCWCDLILYFTALNLQAASVRKAPLLSEYSCPMHVYNVAVENDYLIQVKHFNLG